MNGGTFQTLRNKCECEPEFTGRNCETGQFTQLHMSMQLLSVFSHTYFTPPINVHIVDLRPVCHNNGTVIKEADGVYSCQCENQYTGKYCESGKQLQFENKL